jgi:hypothetical protein
MHTGGPPASSVSRKSMEWAAFLLASQFRSVRGTRGTGLLTFADADEVGFAS